MCWHKWNKWGNLKDEIWTHYSYYTCHTWEIGPPKKFTKTTQIRTCKKCGKIQRRYI